MCKRKILSKLFSKKWLLLIGAISLMYYGNLEALTTVLRPNGAGSETFLKKGGSAPATSNWESVEEAIPDEETTYVYAHYSGRFERDLYNLSSSADSGTIDSITVFARVKTVIPDRSGLMIYIKTDGGVYGTPEISITTDWVNYSHTWTTNPKTDSAWTWGAIDSLQVGVSLEASTSINSTSCTQVYVHVDAPSTITVTQPNGGENWCAKSSYDIEWTSENAPGNVDIELWKGGVKDSDIATNADNDGVHNWIIPSGQIEGSDYKVKIISVNDTSISDMSDDTFSIVAPIITVTSPNGGETWCLELSYDITWTSECISGNVNIELYKGGSFNSTIASDVPINDLYNWTIPAAQERGIDYKVKITSVNDSSVWDESDNEFTIRPPYIIVTKPNGGEFWLKGTSHDITWITGGVSGNVKIELYKGDSLNSTIASDVPNNEAYSWGIPATQTLGNDYKVKITSLDNSSFWDESNDYFGIIEPITVTLISPNGGESWDGGSSHGITWSSTGAGFDSYRLLYSLTSDSGWTTVAHSISSPHPYPEMYDSTWIISHPGAQRIKVHFSKFETEDDFDLVYLYDKDNNKVATYSGNLGAFWSTEIPGNIVEIRLHSDDSENGYGFDIDEYEALHDYDTITTNISPDSSSWNWTLPNVNSTTCKVKIQILNDSNDVIVEDKSDNYFSIISVGTEEEIGALNLTSLQIYPNPARGKISFRLSVIGYRLTNNDLRLTIYDLSGRMVKALPITDYRLPITEVTWDGSDSEGKKVKSGIYFYRIESVILSDSEESPIIKGKFVILK